MKKFNVIVSVLMLPVFFLGFSGTTMAKTVKLTYSNFFPPTHIQSQLAEAWCKEVELKTNGEVKIEYYPAGTLSKGPKIYDGVVQGISDIGFSVLAYSRGRFPVMGAVDLPLGYTSGVQATKAANAVYEKFRPKEFRNVQVMYFHAHGPGLFFNSQKAIRSINDLKGLKLRATGYSAKIVKAAGGTPVGMPMPHSYQNIQKGVVDGGVFPMEANKGWRLGEVVKYGTATYSIAYTTAFFVVMNKDKWNSLSKNTQDTIRIINKEWIPKHGNAWDYSDSEGLKYFMNQGNQLNGVDKNEAERWERAVSPIVDEYKKELNKKRLNGDEVINYLKSQLNAK
jgi:TRAP-type C4-dicarboxylate transport system substrate-binding protein